MSKVSCFLTKNPSIRGEEAADAPTQTVNTKTKRLTIDHLAIHIEALCFRYGIKLVRWPNSR